MRADPTTQKEKTTRRIQVGTKGGWTPKYNKDPGSKVREKKQMEEVLGRYN